MRSDNDVEVVEGCYERQFTILLFCVETIIKSSGSRTSLPASTTMCVIRMQPACECTSMNTTPSINLLVLSVKFCIIVAFCSSGILKTGATSEARREGGDSQSPGALTRSLVCVSLCSCVSSPLPNLTFVPNQWITHERLSAMSCPLRPQARQVNRRRHDQSWPAYLHKVEEMQKEVKPANQWRGLIQETWGFLPQSQPAKTIPTTFTRRHSNREGTLRKALGVSLVRQSLNPGISGLASIDSILSWRNRRLD